MKTAITNIYLIKIASFILSLSVLSANAANLLNLDATSLPGDKVELKLSFDQPVDLPKGFTIDDPARIALDFAGVKSQLNANDFTFNIGATRSVNVLDSPQSMRLHINLNTLKPYNTYVKGNDLYIIIGETTVSTMQSANDVEQKQIAKQVYGERIITNIDFRPSPKPGEEKVGNIIIDLSDAKISPNVKEQPRQIILEFANTQIPEELRLKLDVQDYSTPVSFITAINGNNKATVTIEAKGEYEHLLYQTNNKLVVSVREMVGKEDPYKGANVSMHFQEIETREALMLLVEEAKDPKTGKNLRNLVMSDSVSGSVGLKLDNVPWDQAFNIVLEMNGLLHKIDGNTIFVAPANELADLQTLIKESAQRIKNSLPLRKEIIPLSYAQAADVVALYQTITNDTGTVGSIATDERTNSIVANKTQDQIEELRSLVTKLDVPLRQVMIEARIVNVNRGNTDDFGIIWSGGKVKGGNYVTGPGYVPPSPGGTGASIPIPVMPIVNFGDKPTIGGQYGLSIGRIASNYVLGLQIAASVTAQNSEVVSQPRVIASDRTSANISIGQKIPYKAQADGGGTTTEFQDVNVSLDVTPQITPDNSILLTVGVTNDNPLAKPADYEGVPIETQTLTAEVLVKDGETIVLGGMINKKQEQTSYKVPLLGDIPFFGKAFRNTSNTDNKKETLIFITPRIIDNRPIAAN